MVIALNAGILAGDAAAIRLFIRQHAPRFLRIIRRHMPRDRSPTDAEDVLQEILIAIVGGLFVMEALSVVLQVSSFKLRGLQRKWILRRAFGAHFTHPSDIMKIVKPTITDPWQERSPTWLCAARLPSASPARSASFWRPMPFTPIPGRRPCSGS